MKTAICHYQHINDQCRFLLMEMGIGVLHNKMARIIDNILNSFPNLAEPESHNHDEINHNIVLKALNDVYDKQASYYASESSLSSINPNDQVNRIEQFLFMQQLANRQYIKCNASPYPKHLSLRECIQYMPAFQAKIQCYGVKPSLTTQCVPIHPWLWRNHLKNNAYSDCLPCINHKKSWNASNDIFYLQDNDCHFLSFYSEMTPDKSHEINEILNALDSTYKYHFLITEERCSVPINNKQNLNVSRMASPFQLLSKHSTLVPLHACHHPTIKNQLPLSLEKINRIIQWPFQQLKKQNQIILDACQVNPILSFENGELTGVLYQKLFS